MAVPGSGTINMLGIAQERKFGTYGSGTISNPILSNDLVNSGGLNSFPALNSSSPTLPSTSTPFELDAWYGYDQDAFSGPTAYLSSGAGRNPCAFSSSDRTLYHSGSGAYPTVGDTVYSNSAGSTKVSGGNRRWFFSANNGGATYFVQFASIGGSNTGLVTSVAICP